MKIYYNYWLFDSFGVDLLYINCYIYLTTSWSLILYEISLTNVGGKKSRLQFMALSATFVLLT